MNITFSTAKREILITCTLHDEILKYNLRVGVICFISTFYINWRVNMVIVSRLEGMGIFSACRVYFKYFLTKTYLNMCSDMLFIQMHLAVTSWHFVLSPY